jgi:hypothetical protein
MDDIIHTSKSRRYERRAILKRSIFQRTQSLKENMGDRHFQAYVRSGIAINPKKAIDNKGFVKAQQSWQEDPASRTIAR